MAKDKFRNRDYEDDYLDKQSEKKKPRKKQKARAKYFDEFDTYEAHNRYNQRTGRFRY